MKVFALLSRFLVALLTLHDFLRIVAVCSALWKQMSGPDVCMTPEKGLGKQSQVKGWGVRRWGGIRLGWELRNYNQVVWGPLVETMSFHWSEAQWKNLTFPSLLLIN